MQKFPTLVIACALLLAAHPVPAEPGTGGGQLSFKATLSSLKISARPGQVQTREFRLTLDPDQVTTRFKAHMQDWWRSEDGSQSFYAEPGTLAKSCGRWVTLNPVESDVRAGETLTTRLTVSVPGEATSGGYWCVLTVDELPDPLAAPEGVGIRFMASVSVGVFIYVGEVQRAAELTAVDVRGDTAVVRIRNTGDTPLAIEGRFEFILPGAVEPMAVINLARGTLLTEPIATGLFSIPLPDSSALPSGRYRVRAIVDYGVDHYIGTEREMDIVRAGPVLTKAH